MYSANSSIQVSATRFRFCAAEKIVIYWSVHSKGDFNCTRNWKEKSKRNHTNSGCSSWRLTNTTTRVFITTRGAMWLAQGFAHISVSGIGVSCQLDNWSEPGKIQFAVITTFSPLLLLNNYKNYFSHRNKAVKAGANEVPVRHELLKVFQGIVRDLAKNEDKQADILFSQWQREPSIAKFKTVCSDDTSYMGHECQAEFSYLLHKEVGWREAPSSYSSLQVFPWDEGRGGLMEGKEVYSFGAWECMGSGLEAQPLCQFCDSLHRKVRTLICTYIMGVVVGLNTGTTSSA